MEIHVFVNREKVEVSSAQLSGAQLLTLAGFSGTSWELFQLRGEGDPTGGTLKLATDQLNVKESDHFRVIPGNRTFGA
jgi:hypothetical protein